MKLTFYAGFYKCRPIAIIFGKIMKKGLSFFGALVELCMRVLLSMHTVSSDITMQPHKLKYGMAMQKFAVTASRTAHSG